MNWREQSAFDEKGIEFEWGRQWGYLIDYKPQMNTVTALRIAMDVMEGNGLQWTEDEKKAALGMLAGVRAQAGVFGPDAEVLGFRDGMHATKQIDIWVFG